VTTHRQTQIVKHFTRIFRAGCQAVFLQKAAKPTESAVMAVLVVSTDSGDFAIQEHEISTITAAELCQLRISRADLHRLFAEAAKLLLGIRPRDKARLVVTRAPHGYWEVHADSHHETAAQEA
jgi:hypothetical protein